MTWWFFPGSVVPFLGMIPCGLDCWLRLCSLRALLFRGALWLFCSLRLAALFTEKESDMAILTLEVKDLDGKIVHYPIDSLDAAVAIVYKDYAGWACEFAHVLGNCGQLVARMIHPRLPAEVFDRTLAYTPCSLLGEPKVMQLEITMPNGTNIFLRPLALGDAINTVQKNFNTCKTAYLWSASGELLARIVHSSLGPKVFYDALRKDRLAA